MNHLQIFFFFLNEPHVCGVMCQLPVQKNGSCWLQLCVITSAATCHSPRESSETHQNVAKYLELLFFTRSKGKSNITWQQHLAQKCFALSRLKWALSEKRLHPSPASFKFPFVGLQGVRERFSLFSLKLSSAFTSWDRHTEIPFICLFGHVWMLLIPACFYPPFHLLTALQQLHQFTCMCITWLSDCHRCRPVWQAVDRLDTL